jgi:hypothetical protein
MKSKIIILFIITLHSIIISCSDDAEQSNEIFLDPGYCSNTALDCTINYPLVVGYIKKDNTGSYEITGNTIIEGKDYFVWSLKDQGNVTENYDRLEGTKLFSRYTSSGSISDEFMVIDFSSAVNTEWEVTNYYDLGAAILKMESKDATLTIKNVTFNNAIKVSVSFPDTPAYNYYEYYLPGLGFVKGYNDFVEFHLGGKIYLIK